MTQVNARLRKLEAARRGLDAPEEFILIGRTADDTDTEVIRTTDPAVVAAWRAAHPGKVINTPFEPDPNFARR